MNGVLAWLTMMSGMDLRAEISYEAAPDEVFEMLCDEAFRTAVCQATGSSTYDVSVERDGETAAVRIQRVMPAKVPDLAKKFVGDSIEVVQTERWDGQHAEGTRTARLRVEIPGQPGSMNGSVTLTSSGGGTRELIAGEVSVRIPLVGKKLEAEVARGIKAAITVEEQVGRKWLAGER